MRMGASLIAIGALGTIIVRIYLKMEADDIGVGAALWHLFRFFTLWTNTLVGIVCLWLAFGRRVPEWATSCLVLAIVVVAGVYHAILAQNSNHEGIDWWIDQMLHTFIPLAYVGFWLMALPKVTLGWRDMLFWMGYPLLYCIYALGRGAMDGVYPYGFLNVTNLGANGVAVNVAGLVVVFALGGVLMLGMARAARRR